MLPLTIGHAAFLFCLVMLLSACATKYPVIDPDLLPADVGTIHVSFQRFDYGWAVKSGVTRAGNGTKIGHECGVSKMLDINTTLHARIFVVRETCRDASLNTAETKWLNHVARYYAAAIEQSPVLRQLFDDLGPISFDWYLVEDDARFVLEKSSSMNLQDMRTPHLTMDMTLSSAEAENEVLQWRATIGVATVTHEYFHVLAERENFKFERPSLNELTAYFLDHATAVEFGVEYTPTPKAYLEKSLDNVWAEALVPAEAGLDSSIAGLRLAHVMLKKARQCPSPNEALRGTARLVYMHVKEHNGMTFDALKKIDQMSCDIRQSKGDGGVTWQCKEPNQQNCSL